MKVNKSKGKNMVLRISLLVIGICLIAVGVYFAVGQLGNDGDNGLGNQVVQTQTGENSNDKERESKLEIVMSGDVKYAYLDETKKVGDVEFSNFEIKLVGRNKSEFRADVKNTADKFLESSKVRIKVFNENGEVTDTFGGLLTELANFEPNMFMTVVLMDLTQASDFEIEIVEE